jgi:uncharacterized membrane protein YgaE (UPF0421/DUF939 family)
VSAAISNPYAWRLLLADMQPSPPRIRSAVRITVGLAIIALFGYATKTEIYRGGLSLIVLCFLNPIGSFRITLNRMIGNVIGCTLGALVASAFVQMPAAFGLVVFVLNTVMMFLTYRGYAAFLSFVGPLTFNLVTFYAITHPEGYGGYAWRQFIEFSLGILVTMLVQRLLWPVDIHTGLVRALADKLAAMRVNARATGEALRGRPAAIERDLPPPHRLAAQLSLLDHAVFEVTSVFRFQPQWSAMLLLAEDIHVALFEAATHAATLAPAIRARVREIVEPAAAHGEAIADLLEDLADCTRRGAVPTTASRDRAAGTAELLDAALRSARADHRLDVLASAEASGVNALVECLRSAHRQASGIALRLEEVNRAADAARKDAAPYLILRPIGRMHVLTQDPDDAVRSLKVGLCAFVLLAMTSAMKGLPTTTVETCVLLSAVSTGLGGFIQKGINRFAGALIGMLVALTTTAGLLPTMDSIAPLMVVLVAVVFPLAFVVSCGDRVNYIGMQALVTWFIVTFVGTRPQLSVGYDTSYASGVFVGFLVYGAIFLAFEPPSSAKRIRRLTGVFCAGVADLIRQSAAHPEQERPGGMIPFERQLEMHDAMKHLAEYVATSDYERLFGVERATQGQLNRMLDDVHLVYRKAAGLHALRGRLPAASLRSDSGLAVARAAEIAAQWLECIGAQWSDGSLDPQDHRRAMDHAMEPVERHLMDDRASQRFAAWSAAELSAHFAQLAVLADLRRRLADFEDLTHTVNVRMRRTARAAAAAAPGAAA